MALGLGSWARGPGCGLGARALVTFTDDIIIFWLRPCPGVKYSPSVPGPETLGVLADPDPAWAWTWIVGLSEPNIHFRSRGLKRWGCSRIQLGFGLLVSLS